MGFHLFAHAKLKCQNLHGGWVLIQMTTFMLDLIVSMSGHTVDGRSPANHL